MVICSASLFMSINLHSVIGELDLSCRSFNALIDWVRYESIVRQRIWDYLNFKDGGCQYVFNQSVDEFQARMYDNFRDIARKYEPLQFLFLEEILFFRTLNDVFNDISATGSFEWINLVILSRRFIYLDDKVLFLLNFLSITSTWFRLPLYVALMDFSQNSESMSADSHS